MAAKGKQLSSAATAGAWPASAFWTFSVDLYERPGVEAACIALQDRRHFDVNMLLWALWLADCGVALDQATLARAEAEIAVWQAKVVQPLRSLRRHLRRSLDQAKAGDIADQWPDRVTTLRQTILALELDGEHIEQLTLGRLGDELKPTRRAGGKLACDNLACLQIFKEEDRGDLANLLVQVFPDAYRARLDAALDSVFNEA
ncbi:MAG: TIGR02444 family protein [Pseudomonadota bacterium]